MPTKDRNNNIVPTPEQAMTAGKIERLFNNLSTVGDLKDMLKNSFFSIPSIMSTTHRFGKPEDDKANNISLESTLILDTSLVYLEDNLDASYYFGKRLFNFLKKALNDDKIIVDGDKQTIHISYDIGGGITNDDVVIEVSKIGESSYEFSVIKNETILKERVLHCISSLTEYMEKEAYSIPLVLDRCFDMKLHEVCSWGIFISPSLYREAEQFCKHIFMKMQEDDNKPLIGIYGERPIESYSWSMPMRAEKMNLIHYKDAIEMYKFVID